jgi:hypothetical protein
MMMLALTSKLPIVGPAAQQRRKKRLAKYTPSIKILKWYFEKKLG